MDNNFATSGGHGRLYEQVTRYLRLEGQLEDLQKSRRRLDEDEVDEHREIVPSIEQHYRDGAIRESGHRLARNSQIEQDMDGIRQRLAQIPEDLIRDGTAPPETWIGLEDKSRYVRLYDGLDGEKRIVCVPGEAVRSSPSSSFAGVLLRHQEIGLYGAQAVQVPGWLQVIPRALAAALGGAIYGLIAVYGMWLAILLMLGVGGADGGPSTMTQGTPVALVGAVLLMLCFSGLTVRAFYREKAFKQRVSAEMEDSTLPVSGASSVSHALARASRKPGPRPGANTNNLSDLYQGQS